MIAVVLIRIIIMPHVKWTCVICSYRASRYRDDYATFTECRNVEQPPAPCPSALPLVRRETS